MDNVRYVPGSGNLGASLMIIGEAPGETECRAGRPFVGVSGKLLDQALTYVGWDREQFYITNAVKVRPPNNRKPTNHEITIWKPFLMHEIQKVAPVVLITLGATAAKAIDPAINLSKDHGVARTFNYKGFPFLLAPLFHPSYILRGFESKENWFKDFVTIKYETGVS